MHLSPEQESVLNRFADYNDDGVSKAIVDSWKTFQPDIYNIVQELINLDLLDLEKSTKTFYITFEGYAYIERLSAREPELSNDPFEETEELVKDKPHFVLNILYAVFVVFSILRVLDGCADNSYQNQPNYEFQFTPETKERLMELLKHKRDSIEAVRDSTKIIESNVSESN